MEQNISVNRILSLLQNRAVSREKAVYSCCSANEYVIRAVLRRAKANSTVALIEATANQVNQDGGYTGMTPADFRSFLCRIAKEENFPFELVICGGDHLGPLTWQHLPENEAMERAVTLVQAYVMAGFTKIHIDTSMRVASDNQDARLPDSVIARRGAILCKAAENAYSIYSKENTSAPAPVYVIGSEVPIPGGARENEDSVTITSPKDCEAALTAFHRAFEEYGLHSAWERVVAMVVQPGVEFSDDSVVTYDSAKAKPLMDWLKQKPSLVFEGHSTDYQPKKCLRQMAADGIAILKVGPALTFALREGLFALEQIEQELYGLNDFPLSHFRSVLEQVMLEDNSYWAKYYHGALAQNRFARAYSHSDRARYYLTVPKVQETIRILLSNLDKLGIPTALLSQYMPVQYANVHSEGLPNKAEDILIDRVGDCIDDYLQAVLAD